MNEVAKRIKELLAQGFASAEDKELLKAEFGKLDADEKSVLQEDLDKVKELPAEKSSKKTDDNAEIKEGLKALLAGTAKELKEEMMTEIKEFLEQHQVLKEQKAGVYHPAVREKRKALNEYVRNLCSALNAEDVGSVMTLSKARGVAQTQKEMTTDSSGSPYGGYLVDSELSAEIRHLQTEYGVARREMTALQLSKNSYKANDLVTDVTVYWVDEGSAIKSTQVVLGQETLQLKKLAAIVSLTSELISDSEVDIASFIATRVAEGFAKAEDDAFFKGDGTSTYGSFTGMLNDTNVNEVTMTGQTFASMDADDLIDMVDATPQGALTNAKYFMHRTIMSIVRKLKDDNSDYIYQRPSESGPATIWGYAVRLVESMPSKTDTAADTSFVLFGDLKKACIFGFKGAIAAKRFDAGVVRNVANDADINLITTDREAIRWTERVGYIIIIPTAITKLTTASASV